MNTQVEWNKAICVNSSSSSSYFPFFLVCLGWVVWRERELHDENRVKVATHKGGECGISFAARLKLRERELTSRRLGWEAAKKMAQSTLINFCAPPHAPCLENHLETQNYPFGNLLRGILVFLCVCVGDFSEINARQTREFTLLFSSRLHSPGSNFASYLLHVRSCAMQVIVLTHSCL